MEIRPLSSHTGAEVLGIDLTRPVSEADRAAMNRAFVERSVLVVRDQTLKPPRPSAFRLPVTPMYDPQY